MNWTREQYVNHYEEHYQARGLEGAGTNETEQKLKLWQDQGFKDDMRVLDYGSGTGVMCQFVKPANYMGIDISPTACRYARMQFPKYLFEPFIMGLAPLFNADMVVAHSVFTHTPFESVPDCLEDIGKNLKPKGFAIIDVLLGEDDERDLHIRHYQEDQWLTCLMRAGLSGTKVAEIGWNNGFKHHYYRVTK